MPSLRQLEQNMESSLSTVSGEAEAEPGGLWTSNSSFREFWNSVKIIWRYKKINIVGSFWAEPAASDWESVFEETNELLYAEENVSEGTIMKSNIWENMNMICESCAMNIESGMIPFPTSVVVK